MSVDGGGPKRPRERVYTLFVVILVLIVAAVVIDGLISDEPVDQGPPQMWRREPPVSPRSEIDRTIFTKLCEQFFELAVACIKIGAKRRRPSSKLGVIFE